jgi:uncharacterized protein YndB with AHSA1/START domain
VQEHKVIILDRMYITPPIERTIGIAAPPAKVWQALTDPTLMKRWLSETELEVVTDWKVGAPIVIQGPWYKTRMVNKGTVLSFEPMQRLAYTHLSSLSRLPDVSENHTTIAFELEPNDDGTTLYLHISNFADEVIYRHLAFYWNVTLVLFKKFVEALS